VIALKCLSGRENSFSSLGCYSFSRFSSWSCLVLKKSLSPIPSYYGIKIPGVRMKGIQNKKFKSRKLIVIHVSSLCRCKEKLWEFFHARLMRMCRLVTFGELSNNVDITGTGLVWVVDLLRLSSVVLQRNMNVNLLHGKAFGSGTTQQIEDCRRVKSPGKTWTCEENVSHTREAF
jgi:hypothetical protein